MTYDVIIIGAGAIGAASALELSKAGLKVLVLDKTHVGTGASGASAVLTVTCVSAEEQFADGMRLILDSVLFLSLSLSPFALCLSLFSGYTSQPVILSNRPTR